MQEFLSDLRLAARALAARPGFTAAAALTLALGIGLTTAIFSVVNGVLLRPLPFPAESRLITLCEQFPGATADWCSISPPNVSDIAARSRTIEAMGIGRSWSYQMATPQGGVSIMSGIATPGMFAALGVSPEAGRVLEPADLRALPGQDIEGSVAVISHEMWQSRFGGQGDVVGRTITLDNAPVTIVGIMPPEFHVPRFEQVELWRPIHIDPRDEAHREWRGFVAYARLRRDVPLAAARTDLRAIAAGLRRDHFATTPGWGIQLESLRTLVTGNVHDTLYFFFGAVLLVLVIGCANVANLLLARGTSRMHEMSLRAALGAGRARLVRVVLSEAFVLALVGGTLGVLLALWGTAVFLRLAPAEIPRLGDVHMDLRVLAFALALTLGVVLLAGLIPALRASRVDLADTLRAAGRSLTTRGGRLASALVVAELGLAVVLLSSAGLLVRTFTATTAWHPGFEQDHLLTFWLSASSGSYPRSADVAGLWARTEEALRAVPGVQAVATGSAGPLFGGYETYEVEAPGSAAPAGSSVRWFDMSPGFFATLGVPLLRGRAIDERDVAGAPPTIVVNEALARRFWPDEDAVGKRVIVRRDNDAFEVVGVIRDVPPLRPGTPAEPEMYWSNRQRPRWGTYVLLRTSTPPAAVVASVRAALQSVDRDLEPFNIRTLPERLAEKLVRPRFNMFLLVTFGAAALVLAAVGTYGLMAYVVGQRTRELAVRMALGAERGRVLREVLRSGLRLAVLGLVLGLAGALMAGRAMASLVAGVETGDPLTLVAAVTVLLGATLAACLVPARRAASVDPMVALRSDV